MFLFKRKYYLKESEIRAYYNLMAESFSDMGIKAKEDDYINLKTAIKKNLKSPQNFYYFIYKDDKICGVFDLAIENGMLYLGNVVFDKGYKGTHLILEFIMFVLYAPEFYDYNEIYFNIKHKNLKSKSTFIHLGAKVVKNKEESALYCLKRLDVKTYIEKNNKLKK